MSQHSPQHLAVRCVGSYPLKHCHAGEELDLLCWTLDWLGAFQESELTQGDMSGLGQAGYLLFTPLEPS